MPRGHLDLPAGARRSHGHGESRGHDRERGGRGRTDRRRAPDVPRAPVDDFFYKPYEPSVPAAPKPEATAEAPSRPNKRPLAALLGGKGKVS